MMSDQNRCVLVVMLALALGGCEGFFEAEHAAVDEGNVALSQGNPAEALEAYEAAAAELPETPQLNYDRGLALSGVGQHEEAVQRLLKALETRETDLKFRVYAALGVAYSRWASALEKAAPVAPAQPEPTDSEDTAATGPEAALSKWERAVEHLERALRLQPQDDAVLRNLEIALRRVDPPCSSRNDDSEPNDVIEQATLIELAAPAPEGAASQPGQTTGAGVEPLMSWTRQMVSCPDDVDWFALPLTRGDRVSVSLTVAEEEAEVIASLVDGQGRLLASTDGGETSDPIETTYLDGASGAMGLSVKNQNGLETGYGLSVEVRPACARVDDDREDNDTAATATALTTGSIDGLRICPGDDDWFSVTLAEGESLFVFASVAEGEEASTAPGDEAEPEEQPQLLDLSVLSAEGTLISGGSPASGGEVATVLTPGPGLYHVSVESLGDAETAYQLVVNVVPPCPEGDDPLEDNDIAQDSISLDEAAQRLSGQQSGAPPAGLPPGVQLPPGMNLDPSASGGGPQGPPPPMLLRICPGDVDWITLTSEPEVVTLVSTVFEHEKGDIRLSLFEPDGVTLVERADSSTAEQNGEAIALPPVEDEPANYLLEVSAAENQENFYLLQLQNPQPSPSPEDSDSDEEQEPEEEGDEQEEQEPQPNDTPPEPEGQKPLEDALDKLDRNPQNLEAKQRQQTSPLVNHPPEKDW